MSKLLESAEACVNMAKHIIKEPLPENPLILTMSLLDLCLMNLRVASKYLDHAQAHIRNDREGIVS